MSTIRMSTCIQFSEKPEWVSWDDIHDVCWKAHEKNRKNGVLMSYPSFPGDKIKEIIGDKGKMFVAIDGNRVVGTLALIPRTGVLWYNRGAYGNLCFGAVLPEYSGILVMR